MKGIFKKNYHAILPYYNCKNYHDVPPYLFLIYIPIKYSNHTLICPTKVVNILHSSLGLLIKSSSINKNLIKCDLIKIIQLCVKIYDLWAHFPPLGGWLRGWVGEVM